MPLNSGGGINDFQLDFSYLRNMVWDPVQQRLVPRESLENPQTPSDTPGTDIGSPPQNPVPTPTPPPVNPKTGFRLQGGVAEVPEATPTPAPGPVDEPVSVVPPTNEPVAGTPNYPGVPYQYGQGYPGLDLSMMDFSGIQMFADGGQVKGGGMKVKKQTFKDRYGNTTTTEYFDDAPPVDQTALMKEAMKQGMQVPPMSQGIPHPGGPKGTDTVPAWLTPGEFVMNKEAVQEFGPEIKQMNDVGRMKQDGGAVYRADGGPAKPTPKELLAMKPGEAFSNIFGGLIPESIPVAERTQGVPRISTGAPEPEPTTPAVQPIGEVDPNALNIPVPQREEIPLAPEEPTPNVDPEWDVNAAVKEGLNVERDPAIDQGINLDNVDLSGIQVSTPDAPSTAIDGFSPTDNEEQLNKLRDEGAKTDPGFLSNVFDKLKESAGRLVSEDEIWDAALLYAGSRLLGGSHGGSLKFVGDRWQANRAAQAETAAEIAKEGRAEARDLRKLGYQHDLGIKRSDHESARDYNEAVRLANINAGIDEQQAIAAEDRELKRDYTKDFGKNQTEYNPQGQAAIRQAIAGGNVMEIERALNNPANYNQQNQEAAALGLPFGTRRQEIYSSDSTTPVMGYKNEQTGVMYIPTGDGGFRPVTAQQGYDTKGLTDSEQRQQISGLVQDRYSLQKDKDGKSTSRVSKEDQVQILQNLSKQMKRRGLPDNPLQYTDHLSNVIETMNNQGIPLSKSSVEAMITSAIVSGNSANWDAVSKEVDGKRVPLSSSDALGFADNIKSIYQGLPKEFKEQYKTNDAFLKNMTSVWDSEYEKIPASKLIDGTAFDSAGPVPEKYAKLIRNAPNQFMAFTYWASWFNTQK